MQGKGQRSRRRSAGKPVAGRKRARRPVGKFSIVRARAKDFKGEGLRPFFVYRDLGVRAATGGRFGAHVVKAARRSTRGTGRHYHVADFHMVYVLKGWCKFWYNGVGKVKVSEGDCIYQRPGIRHELYAWSDDMEFMEVLMPADYGTVPPESPMDA